MSKTTPLVYFDFLIKPAEDPAGRAAGVDQVYLRLRRLNPRGGLVKVCITTEELVTIASDALAVRRLFIARNKES